MDFTPPLTPSLNTIGSNTYSKRYDDDETRWAAVVGRDPAADRAFVYGVRTTKIYCRPICKARLARRTNVTFYLTAREAQTAGFRACKRCKPELASCMPEEIAVQKIRDFVAKAPNEAQLSTLNAMAKHTGLSKWHFHRVFKKVVGMTPNEYAKLCRPFITDSERTSEAPESSLQAEFNFDYLTPLASTPSVDSSLDIDWATLDLGPDGAFDWLSYPTPAPTSEASSVAPAQFTTPQLATVIQYLIRHTSFGLLLIAFQDSKVCMMQQAGTEAELLAALEAKFPSFYHEHIRMDQPGQNLDPGIQSHTNAILDMLETTV